MPKSKKEPVSAWLQMYIAQKTLIPSGKPEVPRGRPRRLVAWADLHTEIPQGDLQQVRDWQQRFNDLLGRKVSLGETIGLLARINTSRLEFLDVKTLPEDIQTLVNLMIGESR